MFVNFLLAVIVLPAAVTATVANLDEEWTLFKQEFFKMYKTMEEEQHRRLVWKENVEYIKQHNLQADEGLHTYRMGVNKYTDMRFEEFMSKKTGLRMVNKTRRVSATEETDVDALAEEVNCVQQGLVTEVKDQGECGSCWAFSATGSLEGQHAKKHGALVSLSEQNLVDCSGKEGNEGCDGGLMTYAFDYIMKSGGIDTEESYPYTGNDSSECHFDSSTVGATMSSYVELQAGDEHLLQAISSVGPVSAAVSATTAFQLYQSGVFVDSSCNNEEVNHGVLVVGYGESTGQKYWLVKNSWGKSWGEGGYAKISRDTENMCGISSLASYPVI